MGCSPETIAATAGATPSALSTAAATAAGSQAVHQGGGGWQDLIQLLATVAGASGSGGEGDLRAEAVTALGTLSSFQVIS